MGIKGLMKLISDHSPDSIKEKDFKTYLGQKIAIDASMSLYQFLIAVRHGQDNQNLTNDEGEITSHLQGMFYRTIRMMDNGIKPCYVFDGKPPDMKSGELADRAEKRKKAEDELKVARENNEEGENQEEVNKFEKRLVRVTKQQNADVIQLLKLMGVPVVQAPGEAEAQCAELCKSGKVYATATEDMDALTFGTDRLVRHLTFSEARKMPVQEINLKILLEDLKLTTEQFTDMCILCGCDYTGTIRGIGPHRAYELIKKHKSIEVVLKNLDKKKYKAPENFLYKESAALFHNPEVTKGSEFDLKWTEPDEDGLIKFLVDEKGFNLERVKNGIVKMKKSKGKSSQMRMESFFGAPTLVRKKKPDDKKSKKKNKKAKTTSKTASKKKK